MKTSGLFKSNIRSILLASTIALLTISCSSTVRNSPKLGINEIDKNDNTIVSSKPKAAPAVPSFKIDFAKGELAKDCDQAIAQLQSELQSITKVPESQRTIDNTLMVLENSTADFSDRSTPLTFMGYTSTNADTRNEASDCEVKVGQVMVDIFTRKDLYAAIQNQKGRNAAETRLLSETKKSFEKNGLALSDEKLAQLKDLKNKLAELEAKFSKNLNEDTSSLELTETELAGLPKDYLSGLKKSTSGNYIVTTKSTDYTMVGENASNELTRKKMLLAYLQRGLNTPAGEDNNTQLLEKAVQLRQQIAQMIGTATWADYRIDGRMAVDGKTVLDFLNGLKDKLAEKNKQDLQKLLQFKKESDPTAVQVNHWDINYLSYQLKKRDYNLDNETIREYFPKDVVMNGLFAVYSKLLGVKYQEVKDAKVWSPDVKLYEVRDTNSNEVLAYFYTDFVPREGKYGHAAAFPLISGRDLGKVYSLPVASIVANFTPPQNGKPSLLDHDEVETVFHEFGHIMHQTLTRAPYASLSGSSVAQDFVEAPSQMLENWVWDSKILKSLSGHYQTGEQLPDTLLQKMIEAKTFNQGYYYTRQLTFGLFDMRIHTAAGAVDVDKVFNETFTELIGLPPIAGSHFPASFGHLMGGYDAGYYGYLWSEVYAQDMFSKFELAGLLNEQLGMQYRTKILEKGSMLEPLQIVEDFIGRKVDFSAFYKKLGI